MSVDRDEVVAGETLHVTADIGEPDKKVQGARIELVYRNTYQEDDTDSDGDRHTYKRTTDVVVHSEQVALEDASSRFELDVPVPPDAPGTAPKSVEWLVRAVVDRRRARDATAEAPIVVRAPADQLRHWADAPAQDNGKCPMTLEASSRVVRPGDRIAGTLTLTPDDALKARGIRVQLHRKRFDPDRNTDTSDDAVIELSGPTDLEPGGQLSFPFEIEVPADAAPSFKARYNEQRWYLEGVVDRRLSGDPVVRAEVVVYTA